MAKSRAVKKLKPGWRVRRAARVVLIARAAATWRRLPAARAGDPEAGIHDMRVAAKRLREALRLFRDVYPKKRWRAALERVDALNDSLGLVRDADVLAEHLFELEADGVEPSAVLLDALRSELSSSRARDQEALLQLLAELDGEGFPQQLEDLILNGRRGRGHRVAGQRLRRFARIEIGKRLNRVVTRLSSVHGEEDAVGLHQVRVANKHLRYAIEPFLPIFDRRLKDALQRVIELHTALGDLHDLDVLKDAIGSFAGENGAADTAQTALERIADWRAREFGRVLSFCNKEGQSAFARQIANALD